MLAKKTSELPTKHICEAEEPDWTRALADSGNGRQRGANYVLNRADR